MQKNTTILMLLALTLFFSCQNKNSNSGQTQEPISKGSLFIIGGGKRPPSLVKQLIKLSGVDSVGYIVVLPMASSEPDTSAWYAEKQFVDIGIKNVTTFDFIDNEAPKAGWIDSLRNAKLIYITGGDQNKFMKTVKNTKIYDAMHHAYRNGATIAGTSAGAAIMSKKMITGYELKHPEYTGDYKTIEAENIEIAEGMGFTDKIIVDQHFVWRMRMNRLMSVAIENHEELAVGIDESTAAYIKNEQLTVYGQSQIIVLKNHDGSKKILNGLLGGRNLQLQVLLPGDTLSIN